MKTLRKLLHENICWSCTKRDIIENQIPDLVSTWLQQKPLGKFPRLNNYPEDATKGELLKHYHKIVEWVYLAT